MFKIFSLQTVSVLRTFNFWRRRGGCPGSVCRF